MFERCQSASGEPANGSGSLMGRTAMTLGLSTAKERAHLFLKHALSQKSRNTIKRFMVSSRQRFAGAYRLRYGQYTAKDLIAQLEKHIEGDFEILMVHSSYDHLLPAYSGKPQEIVKALVEFCGPRRTLAMPAFVLGGREYNAAEFFRTTQFDARRTPSEMGLLTEVFRRTTGVMRSLHPTHSVCALGPLAETLTGSHHTAATRTGRGTPFDTMAQKNTVVAGLGTEYFRCLTQVHTAEDMLGDEFPVTFRKTPVQVQMVDLRGGKFVYDLTVLRSDQTFKTSILRTLLSKRELVEWRYKGSPLFTTRAGRVTEVLIDAVRRGVKLYQ
jgi:aminoglycoside 3-N-acetyltransferase